jgi:hypothetical protein
LHARQVKAVIVQETAVQTAVQIAQEQSQGRRLGEDALEHYQRHM